MASLLGISKQTIRAWATGAELMPAEAVWPLNRLARRQERLLAAQCDFIEKMESELNVEGCCEVKQLESKTADLQSDPGPIWQRTP